MKIRFLWALLALSLAATQAMGQSSSGRQAKIWLGVEAVAMDYREPSYMSEKGSLYGLRMQMESYSATGLWYINGGLVVGELHYDGATQAGTPVTTTTLDQLQTLEAGGGFRLGEGRLFLHLGLGYRYWYDKILSTPIATGYPREISYTYLPIGFILRGDEAPGWNSSFKVDYRHFLKGQAVSHLENVGGPMITNNQDKGMGYALAWRLAKKTEKETLAFDLFYDYWNIGQSDIFLFNSGGTLYGAVEPANQTASMGLRFLVGF